MVGDLFAQLGEVKDSFDGRAGEKRCELDAKHLRCEQELKEFGAVRFGFTIVGIRHGVAIRNPVCHFLRPAHLRLQANLTIPGSELRAAFRQTPTGGEHH